MPADCALLRILAEDGPAYCSSLASVRKISVAACRRKLRAAEEEGFVILREVLGALRATITPAGRAYLEEHNRIVMEMVAEIEDLFDLEEVQEAGDLVLRLSAVIDSRLLE